MRRARVRAAASLAASFLVITQLAVAPTTLALTPQTITFDLPASEFVGDAIDLTATATSGLPVSFASNTTSTCTVSGIVLTFVGSGTCTVTASQGGNGTWAAAPDVQDSMTVNPAPPPPPPPDPQPQTITFSLPAAGYVGATIPLTGSASSGLDVTYTVSTPSTCATDGSTLALDAVGTCTVKASQSGSEEWLAAPDVTSSITVKLPPYVTDDGTNLGRFAFNGPINSMVVDPDTGITYVGGGFTEIGVRSGSVTFLNPPASGSDSVMAGSPDVLGSQLTGFPDDASGFFLAGHIGSVNGDGVMRDIVTRFTSGGAVDASWHLNTTCAGGSLPNWARFPVLWDLGDVLVSRIPMAATSGGDTTVGLAFIDKSTGVVRRLGAGESSCGSGSRMWSSTGAFAALASCAAWDVCSGNVMDLVEDGASNSLITVVDVRRGQTVQTQEDPQTWLIAYDRSTGARKWSVRLEAPQPDGAPVGVLTATVRHVASLDGSILLSGWFRLEPTWPPVSPVTTTLLVDAASGTILQRWSGDGEHDPAHPDGAPIAGPTMCTPVDDAINKPEVWQFAARSATHVLGYGETFDAGGDHVHRLCDYSTTGTGLGTRLVATHVGDITPSPHPGPADPLPSVVMGHYVISSLDAFDLDTGSVIANWHPGPSNPAVSMVAMGSTVVFVGDSTFFKGIPAFHIAALDRDLAPIAGFQSGLQGSPQDWFRDLALDGDQIVAVGQLKGGGTESHLIALDKATGDVEWTAPTAPYTFAYEVTVDPATGAVYVGLEGNLDNKIVRRYARAGNGFTLDASFSPTFGGLAPLWSGPQTSASALDWINGRLYLGGQFVSVDGHPRQGLARFNADGSLDSWAPKLIDEMDPDPGAPIELGPHSFLEIDGKVVVSGRFNWYVVTPGGALTYGPPVVRAYSVTTGALIRPLTNDSWFGNVTDYGYDMATIDGVLFVGLGYNGVAAFDPATMDYLPYLSVRTFPGWGENQIYALAGRAGAAAATSGGVSAESVDPAELVVGGLLPSWKGHSASNLLELGTGALNSDHLKPTVSGIGAKPHAAAAIVGTALPWTVTWTGKDTGGAGVARYELSQSRNGGAYTVVTVSAKSPAGSVSLLSGSTYRFRVRAVDKAGNVGAWAYGTTFKVSGVSEASSAVHYAGRWTSSTSTSTWWGGTAKVSSTKGSTVSYTFTGRAIAWVGLKATTRGKAYIYVNGVLSATVDLYSTTTKKQTIVWSASWSTSAKRTITIKIAGTTGRPRVDVDGFIVGS